MNTGNKGQIQAAEDKAAESVITQDKCGQKKRLIVAISIVLVLVVAIVMGVARFRDSGTKLQTQLDLGAKYLEEMDYEQALMAFNTALSIDPKNADAYLGIVEVYIRTNDFEYALKYAREGYEVTRDERLKEKIDMLESGAIFASNGWRMRTSFYDGNGDLVYWHEYTYNIKGQMASVTNYNAQGVQEQYLEFEYDTENRRYVECVEYGDGWIARCIREYYGNYERRTVFLDTSDDVIDYFEEIERNSDGQTLKYIRYHSDGTIYYSEDYIYDENGVLIRRESYNSDNELESYSLPVYGEEGELLQTQFYDIDGTLTAYWEEIYDDEGKRIGSRYYHGGVLKSEVMYH